MKRLFIVGNDAFIVHAIRLALRYSTGVSVFGVIDGQRSVRRAVREAQPDVVVVDGLRDAGPHDTPAHEDPWNAVTRELDRSRRYRHPLTVVRISPGEPSGHRSLAARTRREGRPGRRADPLATAVAAVRRAVRSGDCAWTDEGAVYVLLPETDARGAEVMVGRVRAAFPAMAAEADVRIASFPEHALTARGLRAAVTGREPCFRQAGTPLGELEWRAVADRLKPSSHAPGALPEGAD